MADNQDTSVNLHAVNGTISVEHCSVKDNLMKPEKVKSRWRRNSEMETEESNSDSSPKTTIVCNTNNKDLSENVNLPAFENLEENLYLFERKRTKRKKEVRRMLCECSVKPNEVGCGDECLNRLLMIECGSRCATGEACSNKRFQKRLYAKTELFKTQKKGFGLKVTEDVKKGSFIIEYVGEVLNSTQFKQRVKQYSREKEEHYYFMALKIDEIIDARNKANVSRFINHSCDPNCETQKWTVNGELRIGFFAKHDIKAGEELTFDYQFERYGQQAQTCFCGTMKCKGYIGISDEITLDIENKKETKNSKRKKSAEKDEKCDRRRDVFEDLMSKEEIEKLSVNGLRTKDETLMLARLMVRAEDSHSREKLLDIILGTTEVACLRLFLDYHGLTLFWSWIASLNDIKLQKKILKALSLLPVPNKNMLLDSKILSVIEKLATSSLDVNKIESSCFDEKEQGNNKSKSCDTSDSETDGTSVLPSQTSPSEKQLTFSCSDVDGKIIPKCDISVPKAVSSAEKTLERENNSNSEEFFSDGKVSDSNLRSDEDSADTLDDESESTKNSKSTYRTTTEISELAQNLLENWKDLKETFRIPRREKGNEKIADVTYDSSKDKEEKEKSSKNSEKIEEKAEAIKVVYRTYKQPSVAFSKEKNSRFNRRQSRENIMKKHNNAICYEYDGSSNYSSSDNSNHKYSYICNERNNSRRSHYSPPKIQNTYNSSYRSALFRTPGTVTNMRISSNIICASSSKPEIVTAPPLIRTSPNIVCSTLLEPTVTTTFPVLTSPNVIYGGLPESAGTASSVQRTPNIIYRNQHDSSVVYTGPAESPVTGAVPPALPNVMFPPLSKPSFLGHPSIVPSVVPESTSNITSCDSNAYSQAHLVGIPEVSTVQIDTPSAESMGFTNNEYCKDRCATFTDPSLPLAFPVSQHLDEQAYSSIEVNGELPKVSVKLPPNWKSAIDKEGNTYFYHIITRQSQWEPPEFDETMDVDSTPSDESKEKEHKLETHTRRSRKKHSKRKSTTTAPADTSCRELINEEVAKKIRELFRTKMSSYVVQCLNPYRKDDCKIGRIRSNEDFKHLARKLTHFVMAKELKHCKNVEDLEVNHSVKLKAKDFIRKYLDRYGPVYRKEKSVSFGTSGEYIDKNFNSKT